VSGGYFCEHDRTSDTCEDCLYIQAAERGRPLGGPPPAETRTATKPERPRVEVDTLVEIDDASIAGSVAVFVRAGDLVPAGLEDRPRRAAAAPKTASPKAKRTK
jgi:hypothetical protein